MVKKIALKAISDFLDYIKVDKIKLILYLAWWWSWLCIKYSQCLEFIIKCMLSVPNEYLSDKDPSIHTKAGDAIKILNAYTENNDVTNKLKTFVRYNWVDDNFKLDEFLQSIGSNLLYCSYALGDDKPKSDVYEYKEDIGESYMYTNSIIDDIIHLPTSQVSFDEKKEEDLDLLNMLQDIQELES
jgi:hypothetical protein